MNQEQKYQQYLSTGGEASFEEYQSVSALFSPEEMDDLIGVKKKDDTQPIVESSSTDGSVTSTNESNPTEPILPPMPDTIPAEEFSVPIGSEQELVQQFQKENISLGLGSMEQPTSTVLPSTGMASSGVEGSNISFPSNPIQNPLAQNLGQKINLGNSNIQRIDDFYNKRDASLNNNKTENPLDILAGKSNDIQGEINPKLATPEELAADEARSLEEGNQGRINADKQSQAFFDQYLNKDYIRTKVAEFNPAKPLWIDKNAVDLDAGAYVNQILEREKRGEVTVARNNEGQIIDKDSQPITDNSNILWQPKGKENIEKYNSEVRDFNAQVGEQNADKARFNYGNIGNEPEQDGFGEFVTKANKFGVIPTNEEYEQLTTDEARNEYLATLEATQNAQKNGTTLQQELDKVRPQYFLSDEVKIANGFDAVNLLNQGIESGDTKDQAELNYFTKFFSDKNNVMDFGEYWEREGKAKHKSSLVRENQANYQATRANIWNEYLSYKNDKLGTNQRFLEEAVVQSSALADRYAQEGNFQALESEKVKMENLYSQYEDNQGQMISVGNLYDESNKNFTTLANKRKEEADFQLRVEKGEFLDNAKNIAGQIPLAIGVGVNNTIGGAARIMNAFLRSDNLGDAASIIGETEIKVGNVKVDSRINQRIKYLKDETTGQNYEERNGVLYGVNTKGELYRPSIQPDLNNLKLEREETKLNGAGAVFGISKLLTDIALTKGTGKGLSYSAKLLNNSKNIATVFGVESQVAKLASSYARVVKTQNAETIAYWFTQTYNENYAAAEAAGIKSENGKNIYSFFMSGMIAGTSVISPDQKFLKVLNTDSRNVVTSLLQGNIKKAALQSSNVLKKLGVDVTNELKEEVPQQLLQDAGNIIANQLSDANFSTSTKEDYRDVVDGTIITVGAISLFGSGASLRNQNRATVNNEIIDLSKLSRNEVITKLALDSRGLDYIKEYKESAIYPSLKKSAEKIENEITTRRKYILKIPDVDKYTSSALSDVAPILQKIENKKADLKNDDGTFSERINKDIAVLTAQANAILDNDLNPNNNAENPQSTPQPEAVQTETNGTKTTIDLNAKTGDKLYQTESTDNNLNQQDGSAPVQIESPNAEIKEDGQGSQEGRSITTDQLTEVGEGNQESEQVAAEIASQEEVKSLTEQRDDILKTNNNLIEEFLATKNITKEEYQALLPAERKIYDDEYQKSTYQTKWAESEDAKKLEEINKKISQTKIWANGVAQGQIDNGYISATEAKNKIEAAGVKVPQDILEKFNKEQNEKENNSQQIPAESSEQFDDSSAKTSATGSQENINSQDPENEISEEELQQRNIAALQDILAKQNTESSPVENTVKTPKTVEAKPTETKSTILTKEEKGRNTLVGMKNDYNKLSAAKKNQTKGKEAFARINQLAKDLGYPIGSLGDGKISIKNPKTGKEMAKVKEVLSEKIPTPQEVESAKQYLGDVATWDGNVFNEHWESDLTWAEIRKGNQDIENGKLNTVPARRLVNEINRQLNDYGGFNFTKGSGAQTEKTFISLQEIAQYKQEFPRVWTSLDLLTDQELENLYNERLESEKEFYTNGPSQSENNSVYEERQDLPSKSSGNDQSQAELTSPEYKSLVTQRNDQEARVKTAKSKFDAVSKTTNKDFQGDQEDLFGERPAQQGLFDERADGKAGKELITTAKREYDQAKAELSRLNNAVRDFESGKVTGTESINFEEKKAQPVKSATPAEKIDDFGEKIGGAKKDFRANLENITDESIATQPLSKSFPRPDFKKLVDSKILTKEQAIFFNYLYDQIPAKPRKPYLLNAWTTKVKYVIDTFSSLMTDSDIDVVGRIRESATLGTKFKLYEDIYNEFGFPNNPVSMGAYEIKKLTNAAGEYFAIVKGSRIVSRDLYSVKEAVESLKAIINKNKATKGDVKLSLYQDTKTKKYFIGKKGVFSTIRLIEFDDVKEGRSFLENNKEQLQEMWESQKETQKERDGKLNDPRIGTDYRKGEDVTPKKFSDTFGFRGVEFGNYVNNNERQTALNEAYDAFMDLSTIIGVSPKALSLNGKLAMAFGARGSGNAMAHYEPTRVVINLTKTKGAGSLAHEWWHAFDNYLSGQRGKESEMLTDSPRYKGKDNTTVREEISDAFVNLVKTIKDSPLYKRSRAADAAKSKPYFSTSVEMTARAFENYVVLKMAEAGERNHYLANYNDHAIWAKNSRLSEDSYPYPLEAEAPGINKAYQDLFNILKEKKEGDNIALFQKTDEKFAEITPEVAKSLIERLKKPFAKAFSNLNVTTDWNVFKAKAKALGLDNSAIQNLVRAFHGSPYSFDRFSTENIGSGDGRSIGGWGLYFSSQKDIAEDYLLKGGTLYDVTLNENKFLNFNNEIPSSLGQKVANKLDDLGYDVEDLRSDYLGEGDNGYDVANGESLYDYLDAVLGGKKEASLFLKDLGLIGNEFKDKTNPSANNYVVFDENAITIDNKVQFMQTANGEIYGAKLPDGTIYINPNKLNANTPIHEFSHLWEQIMPNAWKKGLAIFKETSTGKKMFAQLQKEGNYSQLTEDQVWSEAMNTLIGNLGEQQYQRKPKGKMAEFIDWFKNAMSRFINTVTGKKELNKELDLNAFTDKVLGDLLGEKELVPESASSQQGDIQYSKIDLKNGAKKLIRDLVDLVKGKPGTSAEKRIFGKVTPEGAQYLSDLLGVNISDDFIHTIDRSSINHAHKNHGDIKIEESRGQIALTNEDYELAADIISTPDEVINTGKNEKGLQTVTYIKKFEDGTIVDIEEVRTGKKELALNSIRKMKGNIGIQQRYNDANKASNIPTPETTAASKYSLSTTNIPNLIDFDTDDVKNVLNEGKIDMQIIGEKGASKLADAENIMANNKVAKEMEAEGKDVKTIRLATGWEKGDDGKWRYEIQDIKPFADVIYDSETDSYIKNATLTDNFKQKRGNKNPDTPLTLYDFAPKDILVNEANKIGVDLGQVFISYPELKEIKIELHSDKDSSAKGQFIENKNILEYKDGVSSNSSISIRDDLSPQESNFVLIHEIQHAIQKIEGFAIGGSEMSKSIVANDIKLTLQTNKKWKELVLEIEQNPSDKIAIKKLNDLENDVIISIIGKSKLNVNTGKLKDNLLGKPTPNFVKKESIITRLKDKVEIFGRVINMTEEISPNEFYKTLSGEVEARNVQTRSNMSIEERKQILLSETEDIPRDEQIQIFESSGIQLSQNISTSQNKNIPSKTLSSIVTDIQQNGTESGFEKLQNSDWYQNLSDTEQSEFSAGNYVQQLLSTSAAQVKSVENKNEKLSDKIENIKEKYAQKIAEVKANSAKTFRERIAKVRNIQKQAYNDLVDVVTNDKIKRPLTPTETSRLIKAAAAILNTTNTTKALDNFVNLYNKINTSENEKQANNDAKRVEKISTAVNEAFSNGQKLADIYNDNPSLFKFDNSKEIARRIFERLESQTKPDANAFEKSLHRSKQLNDAIGRKPSFKEAQKAVRRRIIKEVSDRQFLPKYLMKSIGAQQTYNRMVAVGGASASAKNMYQKVHDQVFAKLTNQDSAHLNEMIKLKRVIAIDESREGRKLDTIDHEGGLNKFEAQAALNQLREKIGDKKFSELEKNSKAYFDAFKDILKQMKEAGMINQGQYDSMAEIDYQPRQVASHFFDMEFDKEGKLTKVTPITGENISDSFPGLNKDQIKSLQEGSIGLIMNDAESLLSNAILGRSKAIFMNRVNKTFIARDFPAAKLRYEELKGKDAKDLNSEDKRFVKYFEELGTMIKENPMIDISPSGKPVFMFKDLPSANWKRAFYFENGIRKEFFMRNDLYEDWHDTMKKLDGTAKDIISTISGSSVTKLMATGRNPGFALVNTPRDFGALVLLSEEYNNVSAIATIQVAKDAIKGIREIYRYNNTQKDNILEKYLRYGGGMDFLNTEGETPLVLKWGEKIFTFTPNNKTKTIVGNVFDYATLKSVSNYSELMFRVGTFDRAVNNRLKKLGVNKITELDAQTQEDIYIEAVERARKVLDFNQGGRTVKSLEAVMPYLNAATQGSRVLADSMTNRPVATTFRLLQGAGMLVSMGVATTLLAISSFGDDDDEDKRSSIEKYLDIKDGLSRFQKRGYVHFFTGKKNEEGQYTSHKMAITQPLTPLYSFVDNITDDILRTIVGRKPNGIGVAIDEAQEAFSVNVDPIGVTDITKLGTKNPIVKSLVTYQSGYDFFRDQNLDGSINKVPKRVEGYENKKVEDFYKKFGLEAGFSPVRTKAAVEAIMTSPDTNPFLSMMYGGIDAAVGYDSGFNEEKGFAKTFIGSFEKRISAQTSDYSRFNNSLSDDARKRVEDKAVDDYLIDTIVTSAIKSNPDPNAEWLNKTIQTVMKNNSLTKQKQAYLVEKLTTKFIDLKTKGGGDPAIGFIKYETFGKSQAKAQAIVEIYGKDFPKNKEVMKKLVLNNLLSDEVIINLDAYGIKFGNLKEQINEME